MEQQLSYGKSGIEPMTSAIPVQCSYQLNYQANWELVGLIAQLVRGCTGIAEVMGSIPVQA